MTLAAEGRPAARPRAVFAAALAAATLGFSTLGMWQVERRTAKLALIDRIERRVSAPPAGLPPADTAPADAEYRRVAVSGAFLPSPDALVQAVTERGPGFWAVAPFRLDDGRTILVNRGFVPADRRDPASRAVPTGPASVTGLLRLTEPGGAFLRSNDPAAGRWFSRDVAAIAASLGVAGVEPFFLDADGTPNPGGLPVGGLTVVSFRNSHAVYAATWFVLAAMTAGAAVFVLRDGRRL